MRPILNQVQYRKVRSVRILANIRPRGRVTMIMIADENHKTASVRDMIPRYRKHDKGKGPEP